jgi:hypothetical protein
MHTLRYFLLGAAFSVSAAPCCQAVVVTWNAPALDTWTYPAASSPGSRTLGPTFITSPGSDENGQFLPSSGRDPARRGMSIAAFDTSTEITAGFAPARYAITSVTVTFTMQQATGGSILYDDTPDTNAELLADYLSGDIDAGRPIELYGVGFQAGHVGFDLGTGDPENVLFAENEYPYSPGDATGVLVAYPIASNEQGEYVDVSNSLTVGYSATAPGNVTAPFDPTPWAIGKVPGLNNGDAVPTNTTFTFDVDLAQPGVREYMQEALATGAVGFYLSSLHFAGDPHNGFTLPYPQWYLKEFPAQFGGVAPTLTIDYEIVSTPGDFDNDGDVDADDLALWQAGYGGEYSGRDFLEWQRNFTGLSAAAIASVPEPAGATLIVASVAVLSLAYRRKDSPR